MSLTATNATLTIGDVTHTGTVTLGDVTVAVTRVRTETEEYLMGGNEHVSYSWGTPKSWYAEYDGTTTVDYYGTTTATIKDIVVNYKWNDATTIDTSWKSYARGNADGWITYSHNDYTVPICNPVKTPSERLKEIIRKRTAPGVIVRGRNEIWTPVRKSLRAPQNDRERRARETLCRVIGERRFRDFLQKGFVTAHNKNSNTSYQIFPGHGITCVFQNGKMIERLCIVLPFGYAPTDSVIVRYLLAMNDEHKLWDMGIKHGKVDTQPKVRKMDVRPLTDIMHELKGGKVNPPEETEVTPSRKAG